LRTLFATYLKNIPQARLTPAEFAKYASGNRWQLVPHLAYLQRQLLKVVNGEILRLIIEMPPRHGKSEFTSKYFPAWFVGNFPDKRVILASYEADFAASWGRKARDLLVEHGEAVFDVKINDKVSSARHWEIMGYQGGMSTAGAGGAITGKGADLFIIDDPIKNAEEAMSDTVKSKIMEWFKSTVYTRLEPGAALVIIMTRWVDDDLVGNLLGGGDSELASMIDPKSWTRVTFPAIARKNDDALGRKKGDALWPARYDLKSLEDIKNTLGPTWFEALYQQDPVTEENAIIKDGWWGWYDWVDYEKGNLNIVYKIQSWDTSETEDNNNDESVRTDWAIADIKGEMRMIFLGGFGDRMEFPQLKLATQRAYWEGKPHMVLIEGKSSGKQLIQTLKNETSIPIKEIDPGNVSKEFRLKLASIPVETGRVMLPRNAPPEVKKAYEQMIGQIKRVPKGRFDDWADSFSQAIIYLNNHSFCALPKVGMDRSVANMQVLGKRPSIIRRGWNF